ncbi:phosphate-repressible phosphate permease [Lasiosphaeria hispida]|uniref:Phosphate transporter n=1 Tax=Lasiosphaeria hispida TaxID=260671 RepID=A0AAJ0H714_9PEZI|nr:phosphate-repressible phosphate permease [Lasiosphaeria hispida]
MTVLHQYDYLFAITTCFAFLDAWNIGANDVANSFATSVSSRCLTMKQAMAIAAVMEFSGSVTVGSRVAETIRTKIVDPALYDSQPSVLMLAMMCAITGSAVFLTAATRWGLPVSTTHSIVGGIVGAATASVGIKQVRWGWDGVAQVFAAWIIAPGISGILGAFIFYVTERFVLTQRGPGRALKIALVSIPLYSFVTIAALTMLVIWKGIQLNIEPTTGQVLICIFTAAGGAVMLQSYFVLPFLWRKVVKADWDLKWWMMWQGPWILLRPPPSSPPPGVQRVNIQNYYRDHLTEEELAYVRASASLLRSVQNAQAATDLDKDDALVPPPPAQALPPPAAQQLGSAHSPDPRPDLVPPRPAGPWNSLHVLTWRFNRILLRGLEKDVISLQKRTAVLRWDLADMHSRAPRYDNRVEYMYASLQILTAASASFIHGANDVANSIGPFTTVYAVWRTGTTQSENEVPVWVLCFGGAAIVLGLLTYGYHVMRNLGNRLTLISPSRGFCMELASAVTVLVSTRLKLPVSTTQCITGATVGVGLVNGTWRSINLPLILWIYLGWLVTVPAAALISGCLMGLILNAPRWGFDDG